MKAPLVPRTRENAIRTYSGRLFWPLNPSVDDVCIADISHALANICRFIGHTYCHYSVADHSVRVSHLAEALALNFARQHHFSAFDRIFFARQVALWGLLHDASEAYLCDLASPIKNTRVFGSLYRAYEARLMKVIADKYMLCGTEPKVVKTADIALLHTELRDLMHDASYDARIALRETIFPLDACESEERFMLRFKALWSALYADRAAGRIEEKHGER